MVEKQKMVFFFGSWFHTRGCYMIGYGIANRTEVLRGLGRFAPVTAANWSEVLRGLGRFAPVTVANWSEVLRGMQKFLEDWVASLQLRSRIGQKF